jgi:molybdopterin-containing oxidoreductase family membrane subunit
MALVMLATGLIVGYGYLMEVFMALYSGSAPETFGMHNRMFGAYAPLFWGMLACNVLAPQVFWFRRARASVPLLFVIALLVNIGMWLERFVIVVTGLYRDYLPSAWDIYYPTIWDWATFLGTIGLFVALLFLFVRFLPMISIFEMRELVSETADGEHGQARDSTV